MQVLQNNPTTSKKELLKRTDKYFAKDENSWMCLDEFIEEQCPEGYRENKGWIIGVANYLQNTAKYNYEIQDTTGFYIIKPSPSYKWDKQNLLVNRIKIIAITAIISGILPTVTAIYLRQSNNQQQSQKDRQQDSLLDSINREVKKVSNSLKNLQDTVAKYRR